MTRYIIQQSTPIPLYYTRDSTSYYAFPHYRKIHVVLFLDLHHAPFYNSSFTTSETQKMEEAYEKDVVFQQSRHAVQLLQQAAYHHLKNKEEEEDVVFMVVPSTEIRILTTFGIDIWTPLDVELADMIKERRGEEEEEKKVSAETDETKEKKKLQEEEEEKEEKRKTDSQILPMLMITDRRPPSNGGTAMMKRYYLQSSSIVSSNHEKNAISNFLNDFWDGKLQPSIHSQTSPTSSTTTTTTTTTMQNATNESGVTILTGHSFQNTMMKNNTANKNKHILINFYAPSCGHCKRFNIIWNELAQLITSLNWDGMIDVMKMDVTKNEVVMLDDDDDDDDDDDNNVLKDDNDSNGINTLGDIWTLPSVYYFPPGNKRNSPIKMESGDSTKNINKDGVGGINSAYEIIEWLILQDKIDKDELLQLEREGREKKEQCWEEEKRRREEEEARLGVLEEEVLHDVLDEMQDLD